MRTRSLDCRLEAAAGEKLRLSRSRREQCGRLILEVDVRGSMSGVAPCCSMIYRQTKIGICSLWEITPILVSLCRNGRTLDSEKGGNAKSPEIIR